MTQTWRLRRAASSPSEGSSSRLGRFPRDGCGRVAAIGGIRSLSWLGSGPGAHWRLRSEAKTSPPTAPAAMASARPMIAHLDCAGCPRRKSPYPASRARRLSVLAPKPGKAHGGRRFRHAPTTPWACRRGRPDGVRPRDGANRRSLRSARRSTAARRRRRRRTTADCGSEASGRLFRDVSLSAAHAECIGLRAP